MTLWRLPYEYTFEPKKNQTAAGPIDGANVEAFGWRYEENAILERQAPVAYECVRPLLINLNDTLGVHPTKVLNQLFQRYESGQMLVKL